MIDSFVFSLSLIGGAYQTVGFDDLRVTVFIRNLLRGPLLGITAGSYIRTATVLSRQSVSCTYSLVIYVIA